ncbi:unnamed protein product [Effrenium voratum]|uniref:Polycystin cation channel PKD1/PKD2 domain-containing protein n=1 Tax=Effrenium voratum TaxID=2562239 RepID=A0AA36JCZ3_9DINO|nr:unnamed protein product [Effrenium voratum]
MSRAAAGKVHRSSHRGKAGASERSVRFLTCTNFSEIMPSEAAMAFEDEPFEVPDFATEDLHPQLINRLKAAEGSMLAAKVRVSAVGDITKADVEELCKMLGANVQKRLESRKGKKSALLLQKAPQSSDGLDFEGFALLSGPLLGLPLPAMRMVQEEDHPEVALEEMLDFPEAEALFKSLPLDKDGICPCAVFTEELTRPESQVATFLMGRASMATTPMKSRAQLARLLNWRIERDDALGTLFFTFLLLVVLYFVVQENLIIPARQQAETAVSHYVSEYGGSLNGPFLHEHVGDVSSFWGWLGGSGLGALLGTAKPEGGATQFHVAGSNILLGDIRISNTDREGVISSHWLLHSDAAQSYLSNSTGDYVGAARTALEHFRRTTNLRLDDPLSSNIEVSFSMHNEQSKLLLLGKVTSLFMPTGILDLRVQTTSCPDRTEVSVSQLVVNLLMAVILGYLALMELKDALAAMSHGCRALLRYWGIWNTVDWTCIFLAIVTVVVWFTTLAHINSALLQSVREENFNSLTLSQEELETMQEELVAIRRWFIAVQVLTSLLTITVVMKFFKGFRANPRLQIVADALAKSVNNIAHFFLIFWTLFACFAIIAHVLFGNDIVQFASLGASFEASMSTLMGEFDWYVAVAGIKTGWLNSGLPVVLVHLWFVVYICFALLVLFNMLLAMVLDSYAAAAQVLGKRADAPTIVTQTWRYFRRMKETWGFISLHALARKLLNLDCHPEKVVTATSLSAAFPTMQRQQALWLMRTLFEEDRLHQVTEKVLAGQDSSSLFGHQDSDPQHIANACVPAFKAASKAILEEILPRLAVLEAKMQNSPCNLADAVEIRRTLQAELDDEQLAQGLQEVQMAMVKEISDPEKCGVDMKDGCFCAAEQKLRV